MSVQNTSRVLGRRVAVYRLFAKDGVLLYVGVTAHVAARFAQHEAGKYWWPQVAGKTVEWHDSRADALKAEAAAIVSESPVHNGESPAQRPSVALAAGGCSRCGPGGWRRRPLQPQRPPSAAARIAADLEGQIRNGELAAGSQLPLLRTLAAQHGVSMSIAGNAIALLRRSGLVASDRPGLFVADLSRRWKANRSA